MIMVGTKPEDLSHDTWAVDNDYVKDKMHHIAAYMIQRAFRCGWDYRRAFED